jgi:hypothetical protein
MTTEIASPHHAPVVAARMAEAAKRFIASLGTEEKRRAATFPFFGDERYKWNYRPKESMPRNGLWMVAMTPDEKKAALALLDTGVSARGAEQSRKIMQREATLREHERVDARLSPNLRDPELYWFSVFGEPGGRDVWGWRVSGHHLGLHFTIAGDDVAAVPLFFGANPAESRLGPDKGDRTLPEEEDMARDLLGVLDEPRRALAVYSPVAPSDILTDVHRRVYPGIIPRGLPFARMDERQRGKLVDLVRHYQSRAADVLADAAWRRVESAGLETVTFAWAGPAEKGHGHYYAVSGPTFMIEYDNTQNGANHIHSVWREWAGDWGEDILANHYRGLHANGEGHAH